MTHPAVQRPARLSANLWTGQASPAAALAPQVLGWALRQQGAGTPHGGFLAPSPEAQPWNWRDERVGWGLVLPDNLQLDARQRCTAIDAAEPLQRLLVDRDGSPVLRWSAEAGNGYLYRYDDRGSRRRQALVSPPGTLGRDTLPRYLLIAASPMQVPWSFQYAANLSHYVGRLDLPYEALARYVDALVGGWADAGCDPRAPLVWSANHGAPDITDLMDATISRPVHRSFAQDADHDFPRLTGLFGADATAARLVQELAARRPALVVTTSHGMTGPLDDAGAMQAQLGLPVDHGHRVLDLPSLTAAWQPDGAIWYSHACCAAGSDAASAYAGLLDGQSDLAGVLVGVARSCGAVTAPLPQALLGAARPLRAFVGHVEPTFDWTLRDPATRQPFGAVVQRALYDRLYADGGGRPVAWALAQVFDDAATMLGLWADSLAAFNAGQAGADAAALYYQIAHLDRQHTVILGDPTVAVSPLR